MMIYIDGFVAAVPTAKRDKFRKHAEEAAATFREYGALSVTECWGDDVLEGKITSFPMAVQRKDDDGVLVDCLAIEAALGASSFATQPRQRLLREGAEGDSERGAGAAD
jgi:uncharacterized protein YbaA (DUF1428 family)